MEKKSNSLWNWFKSSKNDGSNEDNRYSASIEMEKQIGEQIYNALQGSVVEEVLRKSKTSNNDAYWRDNDASNWVSNQVLHELHIIQDYCCQYQKLYDIS